MPPEISVVTIVKNHALGLTHTLDSLRSQSFQNWESIIVVGKSMDNTLQVAEHYRKIDCRIRVVEQRDSGIYEAMNLGILKSAKDSIYLNFMNAGDLYHSNTAMERMINIFKEERLGLIIGGYKVRDLDSQYKQKHGDFTDTHFTFSRRTGCHQAMFYSRDAVLAAGSYDTNFRLAADHYLTLKILANARGKRVDVLVTEVEPGGISDRYLSQLHKEKQEIRRRHFQARPWVWIIGCGWQFAALSKIKLKSLLVGENILR